MVRRANALAAPARLAGAAGSQAIQVAKMAAAYLAGSAARGAVQGAGRRLQSSVGRYFQGDVNQPATSKTVQQLRVMQESPGRRNRMYSSKGGAASIVEVGSCKIADLTVSTNAAFIGVGRSLLSYPLQVDNIGGRLFAMAKLYARWRFMRCVLRFVPSVSSATDGGLVIYYTQEIDDTYSVGEAVGTDAAASAIDNLEFSVREKANMSLHLGPQLLYTTPSNREAAWHSAGVINVVSGGSLAVGKTYGTLYMDFEVRFEQPCAPFDVFAPVTVPNYIFVTGIGAQSTGSGTVGTTDSPLFNWPIDAPKLTSSSGSQWLVDPATGGINLEGKIWLPPSSSCYISVVAHDTNTALNVLVVVKDVNVVVAGTELRDQSADRSWKWVNSTYTNTNAFPAGFVIKSGATGVAITQLFINLSKVAYSN
jgi:hypothetical protein